MKNNTHDYLMRINDDTWEDLTRVKKLDNQTYNSLINEGIRRVVKDKLEQMTTLRKNRNSLENMVMRN